jgi:Holliday junction resolvase RusA-like endonuclease
MNEVTVIEINGLRPSSKKNHRRNFRNISLPSLAYIKFHSLVAEFMLPYSHLHFNTPLKMDVDYHIKGKYSQDCDNALASIGDCLQYYGVIEDDDLLTDVHIVKSNGHANWKIIIKLEELV